MISVDVSARPRGAVGSASDSRPISPGFDIRAGHTLSCPLPLIQEGQLSATGQGLCRKYCLTAKEVKACPGKA